MMNELVNDEWYGKWQIKSYLFLCFFYVAVLVILSGTPGQQIDCTVKEKP